MRRFSLIALSMTACSTSLSPLPPASPWGVPGQQLIEGGLQVAVTPSGTARLLAPVDNAVRTGLDEVCVPNQSALGADVCYENQGSCMPGCEFHLTATSVTVTPVPDAIQATVLVTYDGTLAAAVRVDPPIFSACTLNLTASSVHEEAELRLLQDPTTGAFTTTDVKLIDGSLSGVNYTGCNTISFVGSLVVDVLDSAQQQINNQFVASLLTAGAQLVPMPAGLKGVKDLSAAVAPLSGPGTAHLELYDLAGGPSRSTADRLVLGVLAAANADIAPSTRDAGEEYESDPCASLVPLPNLAAAGLPVGARGDFVLPLVPELDAVVSSADAVLALPPQYLELVANHLARGGALCGEVSTAQVGALSSGALSVMLPGQGSFLASRRAPFSVRYRPVGRLRVRVSAPGELELTVPTALQLFAGVPSGADGGVPPLLATTTLELVARYQLSASPSGLAIGAQPMLTATQVQNAVTVIATPDLLEVDLTALNRVTSLLADVIARQLSAALATSLPLPNGAHPVGFGQILNVAGSLLSVEMNFSALDAGAPVVDTVMTLLDASVPGPDALALSFASPDGGASPSLQLGVSSRFATGPVEFSWSVDRGAWSLWSADPVPWVTDSLLFFQGPHLVQAKARVVGEPLTEDPSPAELSVVIDSVPPAVTVEADGGMLEIIATDLVADALVYRWGVKDAGYSPFTVTASLPIATAFALTADASVPFSVQAQDPSGNIGELEVDLGLYAQNPAASSLSDAGDDGGSEDAGGGAGGGGGGGATATPSGCHCQSSDAGALLLAALAYLFTRRGPTPKRRAM